ncbi:MAG: hypothetical protein Q7T81_08425 [Pseudolabrys sp.]|nr:hypothetical protein [Pseudolabrys sp.]
MQMKNALLALTEAVRQARLEIACYRDDLCRGTPEGTVDRLSKILGDEEINAAMALIDPDAESPSIVPQQEERRVSAGRH